MPTQMHIYINKCIYDYKYPYIDIYICDNDYTVKPL